MIYKIPLEVVTSDGSVLYDTPGVIKRWEFDFTALFIGGGAPPEWDNNHLERSLQLKHQWECDLPFMWSNSYLNQDILEEEVKNAVDKLKLGKATGFDHLSNELLKQAFMFPVLYNLIITCFNQGFVPSEWQKSIIKPILKCPNSDPRNPMNYRAISLLSCACK